MQASYHYQITFNLLSVPLQGLAYKETKKPQIKIRYRPESLCAVSMATSIVPQCLGGIIALAFWVAIR